MPNPFIQLSARLRTRWVAWRRQRNLRAGARTGRVPVRGSKVQRHSRAGVPVRLPSVSWVAVAGLLLLVTGGALIAGHARHLVAATARLQPDGGPQVDMLQPLLPGVSFEVANDAAFKVAATARGSLIIAPGAVQPSPVRVDLCQQTIDAARSRLATLRIGYRFAALAKLAGDDAARPGLVRNALVLGDDAPLTPLIDVSGLADRKQPLTVRWKDPGGLQPQWVSDAAAPAGAASAGGTFEREAWLVWPAGAVRLQRRATNACSHGGELLVSVLRVGAAQKPDALVTALAPGLASASLALKPGRYAIPATPRPGLEDQSLFDQLQARGLLRLADDGLIELAPRDLPAWRAAGTDARAAALQAWDDVRLDDTALRLMRRLYRMADGDFVRQQVAIFNAERRLLAVRVKGFGGTPEWHASVASAAAATSETMPAAASALFSELPQGWSSWSRIAQWPDSEGAPSARFALPLSAPAAAGGKPLQVMVAGRGVSITGATIQSSADACTGRMCPDRTAVRVYTLIPTPGATSIAIEAAPLSMADLANPGDEKYRYIRIADGHPQWQDLDTLQRTTAAPTREVTIADRNGTLLWSGGAPTDEARAAGLAAMLGIRADHANSVAGMLARLGTKPAAAPDQLGQPATSHSARLTIDLPLQQLAQRALNCVAMRRGQWTGDACTGPRSGEPARGRHAGVVILDADNGDILAAAGAGMGDPTTAAWPELRDFDRANPAASPLRLPMWQHDGGVHNSPGSTFKVVSALGLELAAKRDAQLEQLLAGMPLADINRVARQRGFAFRTDAAAYPLGTTRAHVTNYRDGLLDRRAQEGRFGLAQAITYSLNTWFAWSGELSDRTLLGRPAGGLPDVEALEPGALDTARPILAMAHLVGFERPIRLDGGLLPSDFAWRRWDALQASAAHIDPVNARHELRQMAIGLRMQTTPLHMAMAAGAVGEGRVLAPRLLLELDGQSARQPEAPALAVRLDRIRAGMRGVVDHGTAAGAFRGAALASVREHLYGKTGTAPTVAIDADGTRRDVATVWFTGWLEPGTLPGQRHRLALAAFASHSDATGGEHAAPVIAAILSTLARQNPEQKGK